MVTDDEEFSYADDIGEEEEPGEAKLTAADVEDVLLYTLDWSVQSLMERIGSTFDINPAFQRRDAWANDRKSRYIESLMLGLPVPQIVLAEDKASKGRFIVLDGKQRLITMKQFAAPDERFSTFHLRKMEFLSHLDGMTFDDIRASLIDRDYVENLLAQPVRTIVVRNWRKEAVLYQVFLRLNQGSLPLSPQELRQALFPGNFSSWINSRSATSDPIHRARRIKGEDFRMRDAEMLLRGISFHENLEEYGGNLREFLDNMCRNGNLSWQANHHRYEAQADLIELAIHRTEEIFGKRDAFLRYERDRYIRRFNVAVFDTMCLVLSSPELTADAIRGAGPAIKEGYEQLCRDNPKFQDALKSTTKTVLATGRRLVLFAEIVTQATGLSLSITERARPLTLTTEPK